MEWRKARRTSSPIPCRSPWRRAGVVVRPRRSSASLGHSYKQSPSSHRQGEGRSATSARRREPMTDHKTGTREQWLAARLGLLDAEKALTRRGDELAQRRQELPWVRIDKEYRFETDEGTASLADLFKGRSQLLIYHFMFGPKYTAGCPNCSVIADGFDGSVVHLANHDVTLCAVSRAPLAKLQAYKRRMGWSFPWASSSGSDFNYDFHASHTKEEWQSGAVEYNFRTVDFRLPETGEDNPFVAALTSSVGTDWETYRRDRPVVAPPRRVRQPVTRAEGCATDLTAGRDRGNHGHAKEEDDYE